MLRRPLGELSARESGINLTERNKAALDYVISVSAPCVCPRRQQLNSCHHVYYSHYLADSTERDSGQVKGQAYCMECFLNDPSALTLSAGY